MYWILPWPIVGFLLFLFSCSVIMKTVPLSVEMKGRNPSLCWGCGVLISSGPMSRALLVVERATRA